MFNFNRHTMKCKSQPNGPYATQIGQELKKVEFLAGKTEQEALSGKSYQKVLSALLTEIKPVDFRKKAGLDEEAKISRQLHTVITIDEIVDMAIANQWGLCTKNGFIYIFNGKFWAPMDAESFKPFLGAAALKMGVPEYEAKYHKVRDELYKQFLATAVLPTPEPTNSTLINLQNGTLEITDDGVQLREPRREDFLKYQLPFKYDPTATCPKFDSYLEEVLPDEDCRKILAEYLGHVFTTVQTFKPEKVLLLYGSGANGKSVFFDIVNALLGEENISSYSLQNLTKSDSYQRAELSNKLLNYASEINGKLEQHTFKLLASGEPVEARQIYGKPFIMRSYAKLMFNCNELPKEVEQTEAYYRRFIIAPFTYMIPEEKRDPELAKKIISTELSGILNWVLAGLHRVLTQKEFTKSAVVKEQIEAYKLESNSVAMFLEEEGYSKSVEEHLPLKDLYLDYQDFCRDNGHNICSLRTVAERLRNLGYNIKKVAQGRIVYAKN